MACVTVLHFHGAFVSLLTMEFKEYPKTSGLHPIRFDRKGWRLDFSFGNRFRSCFNGFMMKISRLQRFLFVSGPIFFGLLWSPEVLATSPTPLGTVHEVTVGQKIGVASGDTVRLKGKSFEVKIRAAGESVPCAVPGFNCGEGYVPPHPTFQAQCEEKPCPWFFHAEVKDATHADLVIHTEDSCAALGNASKNCFYSFSGGVKTAEGCLALKTPLGRYHCIQRFQVALPELRDLCPKLPADIFALRENCYYEWAERYRDASFCKKFDVKDYSGAERCWLHMARQLKDPSLCSNIKIEPSYVGQCRELQKP